MLLYIGKETNMKYIGTISRGIKAPIIRSGDDLVEITVDSIKKAVKEDNIVLHDKDIVAVTEAVVAKSQGNFAKVDDITCFNWISRGWVQI